MKSGEVMNKRINRMFMSGLATILALLSLTITDSLMCFSTLLMCSEKSLIFQGLVHIEHENFYYP